MMTGRIEKKFCMVTVTVRTLRLLNTHDIEAPSAHTEEVST